MFWFIIGYILAILFPIPYLNAFIISLWAKIGAQIGIGGSTSSTTSTPTPTPVVTPSPGVTSPLVAPRPSSQHVTPPRDSAF
jgi:hypothetical protein